MATSLLSPHSFSIPDMTSLSIRLPKSSFVSNANVLLLGNPRKSIVQQKCYRSPSAKSLDHIPGQFRGENLKDGLMENYEKVPQHLYGLTPSLVEMFMSEGNAIHQLTESITEESISSKMSYLDNGFSLSAMTERKSGMSASMYRRIGRRHRRQKRAPPDLPSVLLDARIIYLGMPIVSAVAELLMAEFLYLDFVDSSKPMYLYINSSGTQNEKMETVASESDAYCIADTMLACKAPIYTVNIGMAFGQAAVLLSLGAKGYRALQPHSSDIAAMDMIILTMIVKLYLPKVYKSFGTSTDMWIKAQDLDVNAEYYVELLAKGTGKSEEELRKDIQRPRYFIGQEAIDYGIADRIITPREEPFLRRIPKLPQSAAKKAAAMDLMKAMGSRQPPSGFA